MRLLNADDSGPECSSAIDDALPGNRAAECTAAGELLAPPQELISSTRQDEKRRPLGQRQEAALILVG